MSTTTDDELWKELVRVEGMYFSARMKLFAESANLAGVLSAALTIPHERGTALRVLLACPEPDVRKHISKLVSLAAVGHSDIELVRTVILRMDRAWLVGVVEMYVKPILDSGEEEEYRCIAELYKLVDSTLLQMHLARCAASDSDDIREIAKDYAD